MKRFLLNAFLFMLVVLLVASVLDLVVTSGLRGSRTLNYSEWNDIRDGKAAVDVLVQGSSRACIDFSPAIIGGRLNLTCYNLGINGYPADMQLARYRSYREYNPKPKVIVQALDIYGLNTRSTIYQPEQFLPYLDDPAVKAAVGRYHYFGWFDYRVPLVRYRGESGLVIRSGLEFLGLRSYVSTKTNGYMGQDRTWDPAPLAAYIAERPNGVAQAVVPEVEKQFDDFLAECEREGIFVVLVYPPEYYLAQPVITNRAEIMDLYRSLADKHGFPLLDYSNDPICFDTKYFYNSQHVNRQGAELFTAEFADTLSRLVKERGAARVAAEPVAAAGKAAAGGAAAR